MYVNRCWNFKRQKYGQETSSEDPKIWRPYNRNTVQVNTKVTPVIIGSTETISKSFRKCLTNITGKQEIQELNKTTILGTTHILWIVLIHKYQTFNMGNNITCSINYKYRIAANLYTRET